jgi:hypothetical protein
MPVCLSGLARDWISHLFHGPIKEAWVTGSEAKALKTGLVVTRPC